MRSISLAKKSLMRVSALGAAVILVGCGGGSDKKATSATTTPGVANSTAATSPGGTGSTTTVATTATTGVRSSVPTTTLPQLADTDISSSFIPESTTELDFGPNTINGVSYVNALSIYGSNVPRKVEINAGRSRNRFLGTLGIPDGEVSSTSFQVEISLDNAAPLLSTVVNFGESIPIDIDVSGVLRVRITVSALKGDSTPHVAVGNPRFG